MDEALRVKTGAGRGDILGLEMGNWDQALLFWINGHHNPGLDAVFLGAAMLGEPWVWMSTLVIGAMLARGRMRRALLVLAVALVAAELFIRLPIGYFAHRVRPYLALEGIRQLGIPWKTNSFPSGHAISAWLATVYLGGHCRHAIPWLALFAVLVCYSRPYVGMHYPTDVLAGAGIGVAAGFVALGVERKVWPMWKEEESSEEGRK